jgi:hypothetical protein
MLGFWGMALVALLVLGILALIILAVLYAAGVF